MGDRREVTLADSTLDSLHRHHPGLYKPNPPVEPPEPERFCLSTTEVGEILGISKQRVHQLEQRALAKCRRYLAERGIAIEDVFS